VRSDYAVGFPEDAKSGGFDNNGAALSLSAEQMEQYLKAADFILNRAIVTTPRPQMNKVAFTLLELQERKMQRDEERAKRLGNKKGEGYTPTPAEKKQQERALATGNSGPPFYPPFGADALIPIKYLKPDTKEFFPVREAGWYRFKVGAYAVRNAGQPMRLEVSHGTEKLTDIPTSAGVTQLTDATPRDIEYRVYLQPNERVQVAMLDGQNCCRGHAFSKINLQPSPSGAWRWKGRSSSNGRRADIRRSLANSTPRASTMPWCRNCCATSRRSSSAVRWKRASWMSSSLSTKPAAPMCARWKPSSSP